MCSAHTAIGVEHGKQDYEVNKGT